MDSIHIPHDCERMTLLREGSSGNLTRGTPNAAWNISLQPWSYRQYKLLGFDATGEIKAVEVRVSCSTQPTLVLRCADTTSHTQSTFVT
eukprot:COSAG02_NODE_1852_length_10661_cov_3.072429_11_plen_89_part_00